MNKIAVKVKKESGQILLFAIVGITIALAIGTGISSRTISSLSRTSESDTASRVLAAAEGGIEAFLAKSDGELEDAVAVCTEGSKNPECVRSYKESGDKITAEAHIVVEPWDINSVDSDPLLARQGQILDIDLDGYNKSSLKLCWDSVSISTGTNSELYYFIWGTKAGKYEFERGGVTKGSPAAPYESNFDTISKCQDLSFTFEPKSLRVMALGDDASVTVSGGIFPSQGFKITSTGILKEEADVRAAKVVTVYRSNSYLPHIFDHSVFSEADGALE